VILLPPLNEVLDDCGAKDFVELWFDFAAQISTPSGDGLAVWKMVSQVYEEIQAFGGILNGFSTSYYVLVGKSTVDLFGVLFPATKVICQGLDPVSSVTSVTIKLINLLLIFLQDT
jgi:hypothetical protein